MVKIVSQASPLHLRERVWYTSHSGFVLLTQQKLLVGGYDKPNQVGVNVLCKLDTRVQS